MSVGPENVRTKNATKMELCGIFYKSQHYIERLLSMSTADVRLSEAEQATFEKVPDKTDYVHNYVDDQPSKSGAA